ncbi:D-alanyl-D-alanine carboxypeptidase DacF [Polycladomyces abyssicola]|uniref:serine-type D-Ala-D-Ala carboxypeptidase n=1 Tax=Polycladomyces abyssicola TaxID=1125966 RepID=A0A8D5UEG9_9BACL|nr:D-alanyl-D-alanine carboxypeptidase family protein [Polycladomyces abyssicola]BCU81680.1 D-alanyl-D-alanine carboxypeptidase DacF [Polycladomyces abyssicola]
MRSRIMLSVLMVALLFMGMMPRAFAEERELAPQARSAVLMDADTGTILYEKNGREKLPPASITKIMTMLLVLEALDQGKIKYDDLVRVSEHAAQMGGSQIYLEPGERMSVRDLLKAVAVASANDASVALAEHVSGTDEAFVNEMNQRAQALGMRDTQFRNVNGLPEEGHFTTAHDIAIMSRELLKHPEITNFTRIYEDYLRQGTTKPFWLVNTNRLVKFYPGVDGLKTGYTSEAKFCLSASAKKGTFRVIAVVMGEPNAKTRNHEVSRMLDFAYSQYTNRLIYRKDDPIAERRVEKGDPGRILIKAPYPLSILMKKGDKPQQYQRRIVWNDLQAPVAKGQKIGEIQIIKDGRIVSRMALNSPLAIRRAGLWATWKRVSKSVLWIPEKASSSSTD